MRICGLVAVALVTTGLILTACESESVRYS
jgi:hypothetical protein